VPPVIEWLFGSASEDSKLLVHPSVSANWLVTSFLDLLEALLLKGHTRASLAAKEEEERDRREAKEAAARLGAQNALGAGSTAVASSTLAAMLGAGSRGSDLRAKRRETAEYVNLFLLAAAWGFGASLGSPQARVSLSELLTAAAGAHPDVIELLGDGYPVAKPGLSLHDHYLDPEAGVWQPWRDLLKEQAWGAGAEVDRDESREAAPKAASIVVPTEETLRYRFLLSQLARRSVPVCLLGPTGSGKTSLVKEFMQTGLQPELWEQGSLVLSATTSAAAI